MTPERSEGVTKGTERILKTVDPIGQDELSYLEFYNGCYGRDATCLEVIAIPWILLVESYKLHVLASNSKFHK